MTPRYTRCIRGSSFRHDIKRYKALMIPKSNQLSFIRSVLNISLLLLWNLFEPEALKHFRSSFWKFREFINGVIIPHRLVALWADWSEVVNVYCASFTLWYVVTNLECEWSHLILTPLHVTLVFKIAISEIKQPHLFSKCKRNLLFPHWWLRVVNLYVSKWWILKICFRKYHLVQQARIGVFPPNLLMRR